MDADKIFHEVSEAGEDWADKKAAYELLDATTKSVLAQIAGRYMDGKTTKTQAESNALASDEYRAHLASVAKARHSFLHAQVKYDSLKMLAELRRTQESTRRAEMGIR
jgi:hypothetical protein